MLATVNPDVGKTLIAQALANQQPGDMSASGPEANASNSPLTGSVPSTEAVAPQIQAQYEADQAQQAREAAAARLARGVRSVPRAETQRDFFNSDPVDIAKSTGIGLVNGAVNAAGLPGDVLSGFGYFPNNFVPNLFRSMDGRPRPSDFHQLGAIFERAVGECLWQVRPKDNEALAPLHLRLFIVTGRAPGGPSYCAL